MNYIIDYLTLTIKPDVSKKPSNPKKSLLTECMEIIENIFHFQRYADYEEYGKNRYYDEIVRYRDIQYKLSSDEHFENQGICLELSGQALAHYCEWLKLKCTNLKNLLEQWRLLSCDGWKTRVTRIDIAFDDYDGNITLRKIENCIKRREFVSRFHSKPENIKNYEIKGINEIGGGGHTINVGKRTSNSFCRFYDKLEEQKVKGNKCDFKYWNRCEMEFKQKNAMSVVNALIESSSDDDFGKYMRCVLNNYISFINLDRTRNSACTVKRWWSKFLGIVEKSRLSVGNVEKNSYISKMAWLRRCVFPSLYALLSVHRTYEVLKMISEDGAIRQNKGMRKFIEDFQSCYNDYSGKGDVNNILVTGQFEKLQEITGLQEWSMMSDYKDGFKEFEEHIQSLYKGKKPRRDIGDIEMRMTQFGFWRSFGDDIEVKA